MSGDVVRIFKTAEKRRRVALRNRRVECEMTGRWLQFPATSSGMQPDSSGLSGTTAPSDLFTLEVWTENERFEGDESVMKERKLCELVVSLRDLLHVLEDLQAPESKR